MSKVVPTRIEAEVKIELRDNEFQRIVNMEIMKSLGIKNREVQIITDHFISMDKSYFGGWDFTRLRNVNSLSYIHTVKVWDTASDGSKVRMEEEYPISKERFDALLAEHPDSLEYQKTRIEYKGLVIEERPVTVSLDFVTLTGTNTFTESHHAFLELEVITTPEESTTVRKMLLAWIWENLKLSERPEAPTMLDMLIEHKEK